MKKGGGKGRWKIVCPNASTIGYWSRVARRGDFIVYKESQSLIVEAAGITVPISQPRMARVIGRVNVSGTGEPLIVEHNRKPGWYLRVMAMGDRGDSIFERYVDPTDVTDIRVGPPANMALFFFGSHELWEENDNGETLASMERHGSLCNEYITRAVERVGNLRVSDGDVFGWAQNEVEQFRVTIAKTAKRGKAIDYKPESEEVA